MIDGVLLGLFVAVVCIVLGVLLAEFYHTRQADRDDRWAQVVQQQQAQIDDLTDYIADHSDTEANAEDLWGHG